MLFRSGGPGVHHDPDPGADTEAYDAGAASLTPLLLDLTSAPAEPLASRLASAVASG